LPLRQLSVKMIRNFFYAHHYEARPIMSEGYVQTKAVNNS